MRAKSEWEMGMSHFTPDDALKDAVKNTAAHCPLLGRRWQVGLASNSSVVPFNRKSHLIAV